MQWCVEVGGRPGGGGRGVIRGDMREERKRADKRRTQPSGYLLLGHMRMHDEGGSLVEHSTPTSAPIGEGGG